MVVPLLAVLTAAVVIVIGIATNVINSPLDNPPATTAETGGPTATGSGNGAGARLPIADVRSVDPAGDGQEHDEDLQNAIDGDPATFWETEGYNSPDLDKPGVGIAFDLGTPARVTGFRRATPLDGWQFEVRVGDDLEGLATAFRADLHSFERWPHARVDPAGGAAVTS